MIGDNRRRAAWQPRIGTRPKAPAPIERDVEGDPPEREKLTALERARAIAAAYPEPCAVSAKERAGVREGEAFVFGAPRNADKAAVVIPAEEFTDMSDDEVTARLREAWISA